MNVTFTLVVAVESLSDLTPVEAALNKLGTIESFHSYGSCGDPVPLVTADTFAEETAAKTTAPAAKTKPKAETPAAKKKRLAAEKKAADKAAKEAAAAEADDLLDDGVAEVTLDDVKTVAQAAITRSSVDEVKAVFMSVGAEIMSKIKPEDYADVITALEAL